MNALKSIRYFVEYSLLQCLIWVFFLLGLDRASALGGWLGRLIGPRLGASGKARRHLQAAMPELSPAQVDAYVVKMWDHLGRVIAEYPHLEKLAQERVEVIGIEDALPFVTGGRATVSISGHIGNWELASVYIFKRFNVPISVLYRAPNNPFVDKMLTRYRTLGGRLAALPKSQAGGVAALKALKRKEIIGILVDQKYNEGVSASFFGMPAMTNPVFVKLAQKCDAGMLPFRVVRKGGAHFRLEFMPPMQIQGRSEDDVISETHRYLEAWIREYPEQWLWLHRRWPSGVVKDLPGAD